MSRRSRRLGWRQQRGDWSVCVSQPYIDPIALRSDRGKLAPSYEGRVGRTPFDRDIRPEGLDDFANPVKNKRGNATLLSIAPSTQKAQRVRGRAKRSPIGNLGDDDATTCGQVDDGASLGPRRWRRSPGGERTKAQVRPQDCPAPNRSPDREPLRRGHCCRPRKRAAT
jgi:hypothetical protein